jgi:F-type H+-transporting ATPase subunit a
VWCKLQLRHANGGKEVNIVEGKGWGFSVGPIYFDGTIIVMSLLTVIIVFSLVYWASRNMQLKPRGKQNVLEWVVDFTGNIVTDSQPASEKKNFHLLTFSFFCFLIVANNLGLVTKIEAGDKSLWKSPTADPIVTMTLALVVIVMTSLIAAKRKGFIGYLKGYAEPMPVMAVMNVIEEFTNLMTLGLRLFGNIYAGEVLLGLLCGMVTKTSFWLIPVALPLEVIWTGFSVFISCIQAFIFSTLLNVYINHKLATEE